MDDFSEFMKAEKFAYAEHPGGQYGPARVAYEKAQKNLGKAHEEIDRLLARIEPALAPETPMPTGESGADNPASHSEVTGSFLDIAERAERIARRLSNITSRVDL